MRCSLIGGSSVAGESAASILTLSLQNDLRFLFLEMYSRIIRYIPITVSCNLRGEEVVEDERKVRGRV
jgi:hypothetical protein